MFTFHPSVILQLRIYALYHQSRKILVLLVVSFVSVIATSATIMGTVLGSMTGTLTRIFFIFLTYPSCIFKYLLRECPPYPWTPVLPSVGNFSSFLRLLDPDPRIRDAPLHTRACSRLPELMQPRASLPLRPPYLRNPDPRLHPLFPSVRCLLKRIGCTRSDVAYAECSLSISRQL